VKTYVDCATCRVIPEEERGFYSGPESVVKYPDIIAICNIPGERGLEKADDRLDIWVCRKCGTYYYADSLERGYPSGSIQTRLFRMTASQAWKYLTQGYRTPSPESEALICRYPDALREAEEWLGHADPAMRMFGARTLADEFKMKADWTSLKDLLSHGDASVRLGAVSAFRRGPWFMIDIDPKAVIRELADCLSDPDQGVRSETTSVLIYAMDGRFWGKLAHPRLRKIPPAQRTREAWSVLLAQPEAMEDLRQGLLSPDHEVRYNAFMRAYDWSETYGKDIPAFKKMLEETPDHERTPEVQEYLADPCPQSHWSRDDD
jgi:hypothetical protein